LNGVDELKHSMSRRKQAAPQRRITDAPADHKKQQEFDEEEVSSEDEWPFKQQQQQQQQQAHQQQQPWRKPYDSYEAYRSCQCPTSRFEELHAFAELVVATKASLTADAAEEQHHASPEDDAPHDGPVSCIDVELKEENGEPAKSGKCYDTKVLQLSWQVPGQPADVRHKVRTT
jgi:hypothetical protein